LFGSLRAPALAFSQAGGRSLLHHTSIAASSRPRDNFFRAEWHLAPKSSVIVPAEDGVVPLAFSGFWELTPSANGTATEAVHCIHLDPGGALPSWLVTPIMNRYLAQVVEAVRIKATPPVSGDKREPGNLDRRDVNRRKPFSELSGGRSVQTVFELLGINRIGKRFINGKPRLKLRQLMGVFIFVEDDDFGFRRALYHRE